MVKTFMFNQLFYPGSVKIDLALSNRWFRLVFLLRFALKCRFTNSSSQPYLVQKFSCFMAIYHVRKHTKLVYYTHSSTLCTRRKEKQNNKTGWHSHYFVLQLIMSLHHEKQYRDNISHQTQFKNDEVKPIGV